MNWEEIRKSYTINENRHYLMNAAISGVHKRVNQKISLWNDKITNLGAIADPEYYDLLVKSMQEVASFTNVNSDDICFQPNSSLAVNFFAMMIKSMTDKREVLLPQDEFPSSMLPWFHHGFDVKLIPANNGVILPQDFEDRVTPNTAAIMTSGVQFLTGYKIDIAALGKICQQNKIPLFLNATQMLGVCPINLKASNISGMTATCHKWLGAGLGQSILYLSEEFRKSHPSFPVIGWASVNDPSNFIAEAPQLRSDCSVLQVGSLPFTQLAAISEACKINSEIGVDKIQERIIMLSDILVSKLQNLPVNIHSPRQQESYKTGIINFSLKSKNHSLEKLVAFLESRKVYVNIRRNSIRASIHFYNNEGDIDALISALTHALKT